MARGVAETWRDGSFDVLGADLVALSAHDRAGKRRDRDDARDLVAVVRGRLSWRGVVAVGRTRALRDADVVRELS